MRFFAPATLIKGVGRANVHGSDMRDWFVNYCKQRINLFPRTNIVPLWLLLLFLIRMGHCHPVFYFALFIYSILLIVLYNCFVVLLSFARGIPATISCKQTQLARTRIHRTMGILLPVHAHTHTHSLNNALCSYYYAHTYEYIRMLDHFPQILCARVHTVRFILVLKLLAIHTWMCACGCVNMNVCHSHRDPPCECNSLLEFISCVQCACIRMFSLLLANAFAVPRAVAHASCCCCFFNHHRRRGRCVVVPS